MSGAALVLGLHLATAHAGGSGMEGVNPGVYLRAPAGATAGVYRNSHGRLSAYAGWTWSSAGGALSLTAGAVTGYPAARVMPLLVPSARVPLGSGYAARLALLPKPPRSGGAYGLHLSVERQF